MPNSIKLDNRLLTIASLINPCDCIVDVGTDHGYIPIYLITNNIVKKAIATDVAINPLNKAIENASNYNLSEKITFIQTNGLQNVPFTDGVIIAGMGGNLIIDILKNKSFNYPEYILQANTNVPLLREYLTNNNYKIVDEKIAFCNKKYYEIIKVIPGYERLNELEIEYGPINLKNKSNLFLNKLKHEIEKYSNILLSFQGNEIEKDKLINKINKIKKAMDS